MKFVAESSDKRLDVTEQVKMMYDALVNSMDWGSEFLDTDTKEAILCVGALIRAATPALGHSRLGMVMLQQAAGFNEPPPNLWSKNGVINEDGMNEYCAWKTRRDAALAKWTAEVAAQAVAKLEEI